MLFKDRKEVGARLAQVLRPQAPARDSLVVALSRGGLLVAHEVAQALGARLEPFLVQMLERPRLAQQAFGAIALAASQDIGEEMRKVQRWAVWPARTGPPARPAPGILDKWVILADDGTATLTTMRAAATALRWGRPRRLTMALPAITPQAQEALEAEADEIVTLVSPHLAEGLGAWYEDYTLPDDLTMTALLAEADQWLN
ncbi:MAG: phosphoribosyltransferase family protein [Thermodesulfobacteriota bacterium]